MPCGHGFCYECIHDWKSKSSLCPTCSGPIQSFMPNFIADQTIQGLFENDMDSLAELESRINRGTNLKRGITETDSLNGSGIPNSARKRTKKISSFLSSSSPSAAITTTPGEIMNVTKSLGEVEEQLRKKKFRLKRQLPSSTSSSSSSRQIVEILEDDTVHVNTSSTSRHNVKNGNILVERPLTEGTSRATDTSLEKAVEKNESTSAEILDLTLDD